MHYSSDERSFDMIKDGFYCPKIESHLYHSDAFDKPWVQIDLGNFYSIKCIRIITRDKAVYIDHGFNQVEIRFGNFSGESSISSNVLLKTVKSPDFNTIIEICPKVNIFGKFLFFQSIQSGSHGLILPEVQILVK